MSGPLQDVFEITEKQKALVDKMIGKFDLTHRHKKLVFEYVKKYTVPCYALEIVEGNPTPLDSSIGGIPYLPEGETLPDGKSLLIQINFKGIEQAGYPKEGIFQIFCVDDPEKIDYSGDSGADCGAVARYYKEVSDQYQKNLPVSDNGLATASRKLALIKAFDVFNPLYCDFHEEFFGEDCDIYNEIAEDEENSHAVYSIVDRVFCLNCSKIGGYFHTPQGQWLYPFREDADNENAALLFLGDDLISWGDCGVIYFRYADIVSLEKDSRLHSDGDMC